MKHLRLRRVLLQRMKEEIRSFVLLASEEVARLSSSVLQGSVSEFCFHNCKPAPVIIVPGKGIHYKLYSISDVPKWDSIVGVLKASASVHTGVV
ncbi:hypothetical protein G4B88_022772 [Cannabis sativa]|nr:hypothetical protein G4B88_022772 [Cannabis sativa]